MHRHGFPHLWNYIDNLIYTGLHSQIYPAYQFLVDLLPQLGLEISQGKLVAASTAVTCLGILVDTKSGTISIPSEKLQEIIQLCNTWIHKKSCTEAQLQSLLDSLLYISRCVHSAGFFLNRMLALLKQNHHSKTIHLTKEFAKDLNWFVVFSQTYNGVTNYDTRKIHETIYLDASLTGLGGCFNNMIYTKPFPRGYNNYNINHLEMLNVMPSRYGAPCGKIKILISNVIIYLL